MLKEILNTLTALYPISFDDIRLHRDMIGYVCIVFAGKEKYVLKLFRSAHTSQAIQSIEIMKYLYESGYPTAKIIPTSSGMLYFTFNFQEEIRSGVLYEYIDGVEPDKGNNIENIGKQTGKLHNLMKKYNANICYHAKPFFINRYIDLLTEKHYPRTEQFKEHGDMLWKRVEGLPNGFCHGDYHTGNMILNATGLYVLFDFDAAAIAYPVYDIAVICDMTDYFKLSEHGYVQTSHMLKRFLRGYNEYNPIAEEELHFVYDFIAIRHYEVQATIIENLGLTCVDEKFIDEQFEWLMKWDKLYKTRIAT